MSSPAILFPARKQQADETRARLLELAWLMVRADGPAAFTMRQLAQKAGVAVGLPYSYFKTREALLDELRVRFWDELDRVTMAEIGSLAPSAAHGAFERLARAGLLAAVRYSLAEPNLYSLIALAPGTSLTESVFARELQTAQPFIAFLVQGQDSGEFEFQGDPIVFALALWTAIQGYIQRLGAQMPEVFRSYQEAVLDEILESFFSRVRRTPSAPTTNKKRRHPDGSK